jgi:predicted esterase
MLRLRLLTSPLPPGTEEAYVPENIREWYYRPVAEGVYASRRILALYGGHDRVIPWQLGAQRWDEIVPLAAAAERWIDDGAGHKVSAGMVGRAAEWFWRWELTEERA